MTQREAEAKAYELYSQQIGNVLEQCFLEYQLSPDFKRIKQACEQLSQHLETKAQEKAQSAKEYKRNRRLRDSFRHHLNYYSKEYGSLLPDNKSRANFFNKCLETYKKQNGLSEDDYLFAKDFKNYWFNELQKLRRSTK